MRFAVKRILYRSQRIPKVYQSFYLKLLAACNKDDENDDEASLGETEKENRLAKLS